MQRSALCRSRRELSHAYLLAKIGVDTAENEPLEVWGENSIHYSLHSLGAARRGAGRVEEGTTPWHGYLGPGIPQTVKIGRLLKIICPPDYPLSVKITE